MQRKLGLFRLLGRNREGVCADVSPREFGDAGSTQSSAYR